MTHEQKYIIQSELKDFLQRKSAKLSDAHLIQSELQSVSFSEVKKLYDRYVELNCMNLFLKETGMRSNRVRRYFKTYNLPLLGWTDTTKKVSKKRTKSKQNIDRMMNTLTLSLTQWNQKYCLKSESLYYKEKKQAKRLVESKS